MQLVLMIDKKYFTSKAFYITHYLYMCICMCICVKNGSLMFEKFQKIKFLIDHYGTQLFTLKIKLLILGAKIRIRCPLLKFLHPKVKILITRKLKSKIRLSYACHGLNKEMPVEYCNYEKTETHLFIVSIHTHARCSYLFIAQPVAEW